MTEKPPVGELRINTVCPKCAHQEVVAFTHGTAQVKCRKCHQKFTASTYTVRSKRSKQGNATVRVYRPDGGEELIQLPGQGNFELKARDVMVYSRTKNGKKTAVQNVTLNRFAQHSSGCLVPALLLGVLVLLFVVVLV